MNINATILGQIIAFAVFVWFTMKMVWPPIIKALNERQQKIADGLAAAERGHHELGLAQEKIKAQFADAKQQTQLIIDQAHKHANQIVDDAKEKAREEAHRVMEGAKADIQREYNLAQSELRQQTASLTLKAAEKLLGSNIDAARNRQLLEDLVKEI